MKTTAEKILKKHLKTESLTEKQYDAIIEAMEDYAEKKVNEYDDEIFNDPDALGETLAGL